MKITLTTLMILLAGISFSQNDSIKIEITNAGKGINSAFSDFAPVISADGSVMIFTSRRPFTEKEKKKNKEVLETIYSSEYDWGSDTWADAKKLSEKVNIPSFNNSAIGLSADGQKMLVYKDDEKGNGDIYESVLNGTEWSEPVKLPAPVNSDHHESSAAYSPDGNTIYFVSNRPGGMGGRDIWSSTILPKNGKWGDAKNLGKEINTEKHEEGVYLHPDGKTFYFGSQGHNSMGGLDIFTTVKKGVKWSKPENIGAPINTVGDDVYFVIEASGKFAYYTSAHEGGLGEKDIYKVTFTQIYKDETKSKGPKLILLKGVISDEKDGHPLEATIQVVDNETNEILSTLTSNSSTGKYLVTLPAGKNYGIYVNAKEYLFHSENFDVNDTADYTEVIKDIALKKLEVGSQIVLNNIFYDFDKSTLRPESKTELDKLTELMNNNPTLKIELGSHTDSKGSDDYNMTLSQARAQSVVNYLIEKKIDVKRLVAKGYGEAKPRATNDTDEGRQQNRRTEFKILSK
jgi:outer membrane protein OmpA-like peptidoglycan-associated protein